MINKLKRHFDTLDIPSLRKEIEKYSKLRNDIIGRSDYTQGRYDMLSDLISYLDERVSICHIFLIMMDIGL